VVISGGKLRTSGEMWVKVGASGIPVLSMREIEIVHQVYQVHKVYQVMGKGDKSLYELYEH